MPKTWVTARITCCHLYKKKDKKGVVHESLKDSQKLEMSLITILLFHLCRPL